MEDRLNYNTARSGVVTANKLVYTVSRQGYGFIKAR